MPRKQPAPAPPGPRTRDEHQKLVRVLIAKARRLLDATPDDRHEPAEELVRELIDTALLSLDLADVRWHGLGPKRAANPGLTRGTIAASEFVRRGGLVTKAAARCQSRPDRGSPATPAG